MTTFETKELSFDNPKVIKFYLEEVERIRNSEEVKNICFVKDLDIFNLLKEILIAYRYNNTNYIKSYIIGGIDMRFDLYRQIEDFISFYYDNLPKHIMIPILEIELLINKLNYDKIK